MKNALRFTEHFKHRLPKHLKTFMGIYRKPQQRGAILDIIVSKKKEETNANNFICLNLHGQLELNYEIDLHSQAL